MQSSVSAPLKNGYRFWVALFLALVGLLLASCSSKSQSAAGDMPGSAISVSPIFQEIYEVLGGSERLGEVVSEVVTIDNLLCQYTINALICADSSKEGVDRYLLAPLGSESGIRGEPDAPEAREGDKVVGDYIIYPAFVPLYDAMYGTRFTGQPLTLAVYNTDRRRIEQYFENVAFAHDIDAPPGIVYFLSLGYAACGEYCAHLSVELPESAIPSLPVDTISDFPDLFDRFNGGDYFGKQLTRSFMSEEGCWIQIFENVILYDKPGSEERGLYPISRILGMYSHEPVPYQYGVEHNVIFYFIPEESGLGYHVPLIFDQFIRSYGGLTASGTPIAETVRYEDGALRQCFENFCLDYFREPSGGEGVRVVPLGARYLKMLLRKGKVDPSVILESYPSPETIQIWTAEQKPQVSAGETQIIYVAVLHSDLVTRIEGVRTWVELTLPDGTWFTYQVPPTGEDGTSGIVIPPMPELENGSMISYKACMETAGETVCVSEAYMIGNSAP